jgi:hypothetical protein
MLLSYTIQLDSPTKLFDGYKCWVHPRAGTIPSSVTGQAPKVVMAMLLADMRGSDIFEGVYSMYTDNLGVSWSAPKQARALAEKVECIEGTGNVHIRFADPVVKWHAGSQKLLLTGHTAKYHGFHLMPRPRPRHTVYSIYNPETNEWCEWRKLILPDDNGKFYNAGAGSTQWVEDADGTILLPFHFSGRDEKPNARITVARCMFDGTELKYIEHGSEIGVDDGTRGLYEPSITRFGQKYYLTIRHDHTGYVTWSEDGLHFAPIRAWCFDDGSPLGNYNTQQHWVTHRDGLFLVYTRRGAGNDHVFRHRAPLFIAQVDPDNLQVIRASERILVPERGARLGNFGVTDVNDCETWVTVAEWMQPLGVEKYGCDGSIFVARIHWSS